MAKEFNLLEDLDGSTRNDLSDHRPGSVAKKELGVLSPLHKAGLTASGLDFGLSKYAANCHLNFRWNQAAIKAAVMLDLPRSAA